MLVASVLPWWQLGGSEGIPPIGGNAFEASGILVFLVALATLALVALPYAAGDRPVSIDRWVSYLLILVAGLLGLALRLLDFVTGGLPLEGLRPDRAPGLWLAALGLAVLARATYELSQAAEPR